MRETLWVALGGAIGAAARHWVGNLTKANAQSFPWPTLLVNVSGSLLLGFFTAAALARGWGMNERLFFAVGVCGGFTTFSTFSFQFLELVYEHSWREAMGYAALSFVLCVAGCFAGGHFGRLMFGPANHQNQYPF